MANDDSLLRVALIVLLIIIALPMLFAIVMMPAMGMFGGAHMWDGATLGGTGWWVAMAVMMAVPLIVLLLIGYVIYRTVTGDGITSTDPAVEELREAYARGELSDEEFERRLERLTETR